MKYKIGYIDEDKKQFNRIERKLRPFFDVAGYNVQDGPSIDKLLKEIYDSDIDLLMVDYLMKDSGIVAFNGDEVVRRYETIKPRFPAIIFTNEEDSAFPHVDNPNIIYDKKEIDQDLNHFARVIEKNIKFYVDFVQNKKNDLEQLLEKQSTSRLTPHEKNQLIETQIELNSLDTWKKPEAPFQLLAPESEEALVALRKEAEDLLQSIIKDTQNGKI
ncbi:MAG: hypothetical protein V4649_04575 [Bacteroidota bacterium]